MTAQRKTAEIDFTDIQGFEHKPWKTAEEFKERVLALGESIRSGFNL